MNNHSLSLTLVGGPTVLIETGGLRLLTDPTFDQPGRYDAGGVILEKTAPPAISADRLGCLDAVLLSHDQHWDNLDHTGRSVVRDTPLTLTTSAGAGRLGGSARGLRPWEPTSIGAGPSRLLVTATPARHGPVGIEPLSGDVCGFVLSMQDKEDLLYITGDTVWYEGVAEVARRFSPRLLLIFAGSAEPRGRFHMTMDSNDVIATANAFPHARFAVVHAEGWAHLRENREETEHSLQRLGLDNRLLVLTAGEATILQF